MAVSRRARVSGGAAEARTDWRALLRFDAFVLVEADLHTGRTHQIRVHCAHAGCPVIGDRLYGKVAPGQQLHLQSHAIMLPLSKTKPAISVTAPPPAHMLDALKACGFSPAP